MDLDGWMGWTSGWVRYKAPYIYGANKIGIASHPMFRKTRNELKCTACFFGFR